MSQDPTAPFQTVPAITTELINLSAILNLPKPTEAFMSDIHGEYDAFSHVLRNGSGNVKTKISECFGGQMTEQTRQQFAFLVYYPSEMVARAQAALAPAELEQWYRDQALRLAQLLAYTATKYTGRSCAKPWRQSSCILPKSFCSTTRKRQISGRITGPSFKI